MKLTLVTITAVFLSHVSHADTIYVDNDASRPADFRTFAEAHDSASGDDTLIIAPSAVSYGDITITKKLTIRGNGFGASENSLAAADTQNSLFGNITIGNENDSTVALGTLLDGVQCNTLTVYSDETLITRLLTGRRAGASISLVSSNNIISQSYFHGISIGEGSTGNAIRNSSVGNASDNFIDSVRVHELGSASFTYCILNDAINGIAFFRNSILSGNAVSAIRPGSSRARNCLLFSDSLPEGEQDDDGNFLGTESETFIDLPGSFGGEFLIKPGSPALTGASDGGQVGIFGGSTPFIIGAFPPVPRILDLEIRSANTTSGITFTVEAEARQ